MAIVPQKDTKDARGKGHTFHQYVAFCSTLNLMLSNKICCLSAELSGVDLDATFWKSETKINNLFSAQSTMRKQTTDFIYLRVLTTSEYKCTMCRCVCPPLICVVCVCDLTGIIIILMTS